MYGVERLRVWLDNEFQDIKRNHPQIFPPEMLQLSKLHETGEKKHLLINYDKSDKPLALWLARRLTIIGYNVWCEDLPRIGIDVYPADLDKAMKDKVCGVVALYSRMSLRNPELVRQRNRAIELLNLASKSFLIPLRIEDFDEHELDTKTRAVPFVQFGSSWSEGLRTLLVRLESQSCPQEKEEGAAVAIRTILSKRQRIVEPDTLYSNVYEVLDTPSTILHISLNRDLARSSSMQYWAFRQISRQTFLSFTLPPEQVTGSNPAFEVRQFSWRGKRDYIWNQFD